jgi:hypothetical protein
MNRKQIKRTVRSVVVHVREEHGVDTLNSTRLLLKQAFAYADCAALVQYEQSIRFC